MGCHICRYLQMVSSLQATSTINQLYRIGIEPMFPPYRGCPSVRRTNRLLVGVSLYSVNLQGIEPCLLPRQGSVLPSYSRSYFMCLQNLLVLLMMNMHHLIEF